MMGTLLRNETERNYGIDALRLYAMFLIVVLHVLGPGGGIEDKHRVELPHCVVDGSKCMLCSQLLCLN